MASNFLSQLIGKETGLVKERISESLAKKMAKAQKKEGKWRGLQSVLKTVANVALPGVGGAILGAAIDPIGRHFGAGARPSDIKATGDENIFGGRKAFKTARGGLQDAIDAYKQKNITSSILGFAGSEVGGAALEKWGGGLKDALGFGGNNPALQQQALNMQNVQGAGGTTGSGTGLIMDSLEGGVGGEWSIPGDIPTDTFGASLPQMPTSTNMGGFNLLDSIKKVPESGLNLPTSTTLESIMPALQRGTDFSSSNFENILSQINPVQASSNISQDNSIFNRYMSNISMEEMGLSPTTFEQGGMVQKYQEGGQIKRTERKFNHDTNKWDTTTVWDTYTYDGINWNKTETGLTEDPGKTNMTKDQMDKWRDEGRTENVGSSFMATQGEGINDFLRTPAVANLVNQAKAGNAGAMENLVEMARQMIPEYAKKHNKDIRKALETNLTSIDLYGQGYQDVLSGTQTTLEGLQTGAQGARAKASSGAATSGIRTGGGGFRGADSISENLYAQAGEAYSGMQKGIQSEFDESFGGFESSILKIDG